MIIRKEGVDLCKGRWQAGEIEGCPTDQGFPVCGRSPRKVAIGEGLAQESIDGGGSIRFFHGRHRMLGGGLEGPVRFVLGSRIDPASQGLFLFITQRLVDFRRGHLVAGIITGDAVPDFTLLGITGNDGCKAGLGTGGVVEMIETQASLARRRIGAVTGIAVIRQDRAYVAVESGN